MPPPLTIGIADDAPCWPNLDEPSGLPAQASDIALLLRPGSEAACRAADWHSLIESTMEREERQERTRLGERLVTALESAACPAHGLVLLSAACRLSQRALSLAEEPATLATQMSALLPAIALGVERFLLGKRVSGDPAGSLEALVGALAGSGLSKRQMPKPPLVSLCAFLLRGSRARGLLHAVARCAALHEPVAQAVADAFAGHTGDGAPPGVGALLCLALLTLQSSAQENGTTGGVPAAMLQFMLEVQRKTPVLGAAALVSGALPESLSRAVDAMRPSAAKPVLRLGHEVVK